MLIDDRTAGDQLITEVEELRRRKKAYWPLLREVAGYWTREFLEVSDRYNRIVDVCQATDPDTTYPNTAHINLGEHGGIDGNVLSMMARVSVTRKMMISDVDFTANNYSVWGSISLGRERFEPPYGIGHIFPNNPEGWADTYYGHENPEICIGGSVEGIASVLRPARATQAMLMEALSNAELNPVITPDLLKQHGLMPSYR